MFDMQTVQARDADQAVVAPRLVPLSPLTLVRTTTAPSSRSAVLADRQVAERFDIIELDQDADIAGTLLGADCAMAVVLSGGVSERHLSGDGRQLLSLLLPGDFLSLSPERLASTDSLARTWRPTRLGTLSESAARSLLATLPAAGLSLFQAAVAQQTRVRQEYLDLAFRDVAGRVAKLLLLLDEYEPAKTHQVGRVEHGLTQTDMARIVAASRETVNKALADFARRGWIVIDERSFWVKERSGLERRSR